MLDFDTFYISYDVFIFSFQVRACCQAIVAKSTQNYQILSKSAQRQLAWRTLKYHQKLRFYFFSTYKKSCIWRLHKSIHSPFEFSIQLFFKCLFIVKKRPLYVNFSIPPCKNNFFLNIPHLLWVWDFVNIYLTYLKTIKCCTIHAYLKKLFF
jgi:hypothetical protein